MEKSKNVIFKMIRFVIMLSVCIIFLEADILKNFRNNIAICFPFFNGKKEILSNIFIGIWGSTLLTIFNELIEYSHSKKNLKSQILNLCDEWLHDIKYINPYPLIDKNQFCFVGKEVCKYWEKIEALYLEYLPFFRAGWHLNSIKLLYSYCLIYKKYFDSMETYHKELEYLPKQIQFYTELLSNCEKTDHKQHLEEAINNLKDLLKSYQKEIYGYDIKEDIKEANRIGAMLNEKLASTAAWKFVSDYKSIYEKDKQMERESEMLKIKKSLRKCKWDLFVRKISKLSPKSIILNIKYKIIEHKYKNQD